MRVVLLAIVLFSSVSFLAAAQTAPQISNADTPSQRINRGGSNASIAAPAQYFTGQVRIDPLFDANDHINASGGLVTFEPGSRSAWHTHPKGQYLLVTAGVGLTQEWGKPIQEMHPGDVVWCPPGVKHWHGATATTAVTHLAVSGTLEGNNVQWLEKVSDAQYADR
ncbi:(R)-mandelonitrile lyase [Stenotrophomonas sp. 3(2025)]|uniref:(R)-mandelonitrile lyase n=1 Tax=Stenotrophomonas sp. 3(2025) TaxID=3456023 RepID=UPI00404403C1